MLPFALWLGVSLTVNLYLTAMVCIYILLVGGSYWALLTNKGERGKAAIRLIGGVGLALLLSAWITLPAGLQMLGSKRGGMNADWMASYLSAFEGFSKAYRTPALYGLMFLFAFIPPFFLRLWQKGERKTLLFCALALFLPLTPLCSAGVDTIWHLGGYLSFSYRMGFLTVFTVCALSAAALSGAPEWKQDASRPRSWREQGHTLCLLAAFLLCAALIVKRGEEAIFLAKVKHGMEYVMWALVGMYILSRCVRRGRWTYVLLSATLLLQSLLFLNCFIGAPEGSQQLGETVFDRDTTAAELTSDIGDPLRRVKTAGVDAGRNAGFLLRCGTLGNWTNSLPEDFLAANAALGQTIVSAMIMDRGGTAFSDALLGVCYTLDTGPLPASLYTETKTTEAGTLYENAIQLPFGMIFTEAVAGLTPKAGQSTFDYQNELFRSLSGTEEPLFSVLTVNDAEKRADGSLCWTVQPEEEVLLYYADPDDWFEAGADLSVDGGAAFHYPTKTGNHCALLAGPGSEPVTVEVWPDEECLIDTLSLGVLHLDRLKAFANGVKRGRADADRTGLTLHVRAESGCTLFVPVAYSGGWKAEVNGVKTPCAPILGGYLSVPLAEGDNAVALQYVQPGLRAGLVCSLLGLGLAFIAGRSERKRGPLGDKSPRLLQSLAAAAVALVFGAAMLLIIIVPLLYGLYADYDFETRM